MRIRSEYTCTPRQTNQISQNNIFTDMSFLDMNIPSLRHKHVHYVGFGLHSTSVSLVKILLSGKLRQLNQIRTLFVEIFISVYLVSTASLPHVMHQLHLGYESSEEEGRTSKLNTILVVKLCRMLKKM